MNFGDKSILVVDWSMLTSEYFLLTTQLVIRIVSKAVMLVLELIMEARKVTPADAGDFFKMIQAAGHSMGCHMAGRLGYIIYKKFKGKLDAIFGNILN